jgi:farnesyl diphosphate synthase/geranylgeranyl diphosphate synthase type II
LIEASVMLGAIASPDNNRIKRDALKKFATAIGLAFQIQDDILDVEGTVASLGKTPGADAAKQKPTYPSITSLDFARTRARELRDEAVQLLAPLGEHAKPLADLAHFVVSRAH